MDCFISLSPQEDFTSWYKSISDAEYFLKKINFQPIALSDLAKGMERCLEQNLDPKETGIVLVQFPRAGIEGLNENQMIGYIKERYKNYRIVALVHDLDSIRFGDFFSTNRLEEAPLLNRYDYLITVNDAMSSLLMEQGIPREKIFTVVLYDYRLPENFKLKRLRRRSRTEIAFAGDLNYEKSQYLYQLKDLDLKNIRLNLYGAHFDASRFQPNESVRYMGAYPPDVLPEKIKEGFGLCWEGTSLNDCGGKFGGYMKYGNPHKTSLYLSMGLPVIIAGCIGASRYVQREKAGIVLRSLSELPDAVNGLSDGEYQELCANARRISGELRNGRHIAAVIEKIQEDIKRSVQVAN